MVEELLEGREVASIDEVQQLAAAVGGRTGRGVDEHETGDQLGAAGGERQRGEAAERVADEHHGCRGHPDDRGSDRRGQIGGEVDGVLEPARVTVAGEVEGQRHRRRRAAAWRPMRGR